MSDVEVDRSVEGTITLSTKFSGEANDLSRLELNCLVGQLLVKAAETLVNEAEYEFDGISEASFDDGKISVQLELFVP